MVDLRMKARQGSWVNRVKGKGNMMSSKGKKNHCENISRKSALKKKKEKRYQWKESESNGLN